jgi:hypothetical protein
MRLALLAAFVPLNVYAAKPAVPAVTIGAVQKQLQFDVEPVAGASYYELWFKANGGATWVKWTTSLSANPVLKANVSAHLLDWYNAHYRVTACNSEGCSSTALLSVTPYMKEAVGFFKTRSGAAGPFHYGISSAMSPDGKTLAVLGGETNGPRRGSASLYVYQKESSGWRRTARLVPSPVESGTANTEGYWADRMVALSADGSVIAVGVPFEFILTPNSPEGQGAIHIYRKSRTTWALEQKITPPDDREWHYGSKLVLDDAGQTLAFLPKYDDAGTQAHARVAIYRHGASGWAPWKMLPESSALEEGDVRNFDLSGDGKVLVTTTINGPASIVVRSGMDFGTVQVLAHVAAPRPADGIATNRNGSVIVVATSDDATPPDGADWQPHVMAFRRDGAAWTAEPAFTYQYVLPRPMIGASDLLAGAVAVSDDGRFIAVGDVLSEYAGTGVLHSPFTDQSAHDGAVMVFERKSSSWALRSLLKANVTHDGSAFGNSVEFADGNRVLAVGQVQNASNARDIDGDQNNDLAPNSGALWLY